MKFKLAIERKLAAIIFTDISAYTIHVARMLLSNFKKSDRKLIKLIIKNKE